MVEARTAVERRKASAPSARRAPHPLMRLQCCAFRRSASLRFYLEAATVLAFVRNTRMRMHRENEIAFPSAPASAGEGDHWSSRSERTVVEGAQDSTLRYRCRKFWVQEL
jgi:hypothetical protein